MFGPDKGRMENFQLLLYAAEIPIAGAALLFVHGELKQKLLGYIPEEIFGKLPAVFAMGKFGELLFQAAILLRISLAGDNPAIFESLPFEKFLDHQIEHFRHSNIPVANYFLFVEVVGQLDRRPILLLGFPSFGNLQIFEF